LFGDRQYTTGENRRAILVATLNRTGRCSISAMLMSMQPGTRTIARMPPSAIRKARSLFPPVLFPISCHDNQPG